MYARMSQVALLVVVLGCLTLTRGQTLDLFTFDEVKATLERGGTVVLSVDGSECDSTYPYPDGQHRYISMPLRDWAYWNGPDGTEYIRGSDYYVQIDNPDDFAMGVSARQGIINADNTVNFYYRTVAPSTGQTLRVDMVCQLGHSARVFEFEPNLAIDTYRNYFELKSALLFGKHVDAIMFGEVCDGTEDWIPTGASYHHGHRIENFGVFNDATEDEFLVFYHSNLYANNTDDEGPFALSWTNVAHIVYRNGTVVMPIGMYQPPDWTNQWQYPSAICQTGISMQFSSYREQDASYITYAEVKDATLRGHEMELIVFSEFCEVVSGDAPPPGIIGHRFDQFQLFEAGDLWGPEEYITFSAFALTPAPTGVIDEIRVYQSNTVVFDWLRWSPGVDGDLRRGEISCDLQTAALFHSVARERGASFSYAQIMRAIRNEGAVFEIEINYEGCNRAGDPVNLESIYGGVLWETFVREDEQGNDYSFVGLVFSARNNDVNGNSVGLWAVGALNVTPDGRVEIYPRTYDWQGNDVTPFPSPDPIVCELNTGGLGGSVYFFRYP